MKTTKLSDFELLDFGNDLQLWGTIYSGQGRFILAPFPDEERTDADAPPEMLEMSPDEWEQLLRQTEVADVLLPSGAIFRKSQRQIDSNIAWLVFERDDFRCRYCGARKPLSVDHVDLYEERGATVPENLISACKPCNKTRGNRTYDVWLNSHDYKRRTARLTAEVRAKNRAVLDTLPHLRTLRVAQVRTR